VHYTSGHCHTTVHTALELCVLGLGTVSPSVSQYCFLSSTVCQDSFTEQGARHGKLVASHGLEPYIWAKELETSFGPLPPPTSIKWVNRMYFKTAAGNETLRDSGAGHPEPECCSQQQIHSQCLFPCVSLFNKRAFLSASKSAGSRAGHSH
jgi:hypothetical protein